MAKEKGFKVPPNPNASVESAEIKIGDKDIAVTKDVKTEEKTQYKDYKNMPKEVKTTREEAKLDEEAKELMAKFTNAKNQLEADTKKMEDELDKIQKKYTPKLTEEGKVVSQLIDAVYAHFAEVKKINDIVKISENEFAGVVLKVKTSLKDKTFGEKEEKMMEDIEKKMEKLEDTLKKIQEENGAYNKITNEITVFKLEGSIVEIKASLISLVDMIKEASKKLGDITKSFLNFTKETQAISTMV
jgi:iron-sulfur cluster repair protein YtfE (RIC family)